MDVMDELEKAELPIESTLEVRHTLLMPTLSDRNIKNTIRAVLIIAKRFREERTTEHDRRPV